VIRDLVCYGYILSSDKNNFYFTFRRAVEKKQYLMFLDEDCKKRWRSIKDTYKRMAREGKLRAGSAASSRRCKWPLASFLTFLNVVPDGRR
jgi:hypothetical protein